MRVHGLPPDEEADLLPAQLFVVLLAGGNAEESVRWLDGPLDTSMQLRPGKYRLVSWWEDERRASSPAFTIPRDEPVDWWLPHEALPGALSDEF